jgi:hypothetical protein
MIVSNYSRHDINATLHDNNGSSEIKLIEAYGRWIQEFIDQGWDAYMFTFKFDQLPGSSQAKRMQMERDLLKWYGRLATRTVRQPASPKYSPFLPRVILVPDLPVPKRCKQNLTDVVINDGIHYHGLVMATRSAPRLKEPLDVHINQNLETYLVGSLIDIDVRPISSRVGYVTEYCMKTLKRRRFSDDAILILPRSTTELVSRGGGQMHQLGSEHIQDRR